MREELCVAHSIISFDNLGDFLSELDELIETYSRLNKRYEDRLGILLRQAKESGDPRLQAVSVEMSSTQAESDEKAKRKERKRDAEEGGWIAMESSGHTIRLAIGSDSQLLANEVSLLFKVIETLKSKIMTLEASRKVVIEMTSQGFKSDQRLRVVFKDGLPRYVIPVSESSVQQQTRFKYVEQFRLAVLK